MMARTAFRTVFLSAAFAVLSWALAAGAPVFAATPTDQTGPALPPAEYKSLPVGTNVRYDSWRFKVKKSDGFTVSSTNKNGKWKRRYAVFGKFGEAAYSPKGYNWSATLDGAAKSALESLWPLKVGNKTTFRLKEELQSWGSAFGHRKWTVTVDVLRTEFIDIDGVRYATYVVRERVVNDEALHSKREITNFGEYIQTHWYEPGSGVILKSAKEWTRGPRKGEKDEYSLVRVRFPGGTKTHVLAGTRISSGADTQLAAEVSRLKKEAEAKQKVLTEMRGRETEELRRQREEQQRLSAQVARLMREAAERRTAGTQAPAGQKGTVQQANLAKYSGIDFGRYYALVIGIGNYKYLPKLKTAVDDATVVAEILRRDYAFEVTLLIDPSRDAIIDALDEFREKLDDTTNLLIYYAGHGWLDEEVDRGYWLPVDAKTNRRSKWVSNATISDTLKGLRAKHVMVVADSCFSGSLVRGAKVELRSGDYWQRMARKRTRVALTSGGLEPVADAGGGKHSPFAAAFIDVLKTNTSVIDGTKLFGQIRRPVMLSANQTPEYSDVRNAGHEGGDFLFVRQR